jgi:hypothetical protein
MAGLPMCFEQIVGFKDLVALYHTARNPTNSSLILLIVASSVSYNYSAVPLDFLLLLIFLEQQNATKTTVFSFPRDAGHMVLFV